jgi:signal transduction histidine kinase
LKHAQASRISVACSADDGVVVRIADNGRGFDVAAQQSAPRGRGLRNLEFRAREIGGRISITADGGGTRIELRLPLERRARPR